MLGWKKQRLDSRLPGEISITSDMKMTPPLWQKVKRKKPLGENEKGEAGTDFSLLGLPNHCGW